MKKKDYVIIGLIGMVIIIGFCWFGLRPYFEKKECYARAKYWAEVGANADNVTAKYGILTERTDYKKHFEEVYQECLMSRALKD